MYLRGIGGTPRAYRVSRKSRERREEEEEEAVRREREREGGAAPRDRSLLLLSLLFEIPRDPRISRSRLEGTRENIAHTTGNEPS